MRQVHGYVEEGLWHVGSKWLVLKTQETDSEFEEHKTVNQYFKLFNYIRCISECCRMNNRWMPTFHFQNTSQPPLLVLHPVYGWLIPSIAAQEPSNSSQHPETVLH